MAHYSLAHKPKDLRAWAQLTAKNVRDHLDEHFGKKAVPVFVYRGMSGVAHVTALSLRWEVAFKGRRAQHGMIYVRKPGELSHGSKVQASQPDLNDGEKMVLVFVDDFVASGSTRKAAIKATVKHLTGYCSWRAEQYHMDVVVTAQGDMNAVRSYVAQDTLENTVGTE